MSTPGIGKFAAWCRRSDWGTAAISLVFGCGIALTLASCLEVQIGDPEQSSVDPRLNGAWRTSVAGDVWFFRPWDARTWLVTDAFLVLDPDTCDSAELRQVDPKFQGLGELHSRAEAERIIRAFADDSALYVRLEDGTKSPEIPIMSARSVLSRTSEEADSNIQQHLWKHLSYY